MKLIFNKSEFNREAEISRYNNNYHRHKRLGYLILEICHEDENYYEFFLLEEGKSTFLGCSDNGFIDSLITVEFKKAYT